MPPKVKITKEDITQTALELVRTGGEEAINARAVAAVLNCSTQPVFSNFETMEDLRRAVILAGYDCYLGFLKDEAASGRYPQYKAFGMGYIRFAKEEPALFRLLFMRDRRDEDTSSLSSDFEESVSLIMKANGVTHQRAFQMHMETWAFVHGIATMLATSFLPLEWERIEEMLSDVYQGIRARHLSEGNGNGCNQN